MSRPQPLFFLDLVQILVQLSSMINFSLPPPSAAALRAAKTATIPPEKNSAYFGNLREITRLLLERELTIENAAEWLISNGLLPIWDRAKYLEEMPQFYWNARRPQNVDVKEFAWQMSLFYGSEHLVKDGKTLCGLASASWLPSEEGKKCTRCKGFAKKSLTQ